MYNDGFKRRLGFFSFIVIILALNNVLSQAHRRPCMPGFLKLWHDMV